MANLLKRSSLLKSLVRIRGYHAAAAADNLWLHSYRKFLCTANGNDFEKPWKDIMAPMLMLPQQIYACSGRCYEFYSLAQERLVPVKKLKSETYDEEAHCVGSSHGWLAYISRRDCSIFLIDPFSSQEAQKLPSVETLPFVNGTARDPNNSKVVQGFLVDGSTLMTPEELSKSAIVKLIVSSEDIEDENCIAFIIYRGSHLAYCRPARDTSWTLLQSPLKQHEQVVYAAKDGLFYTLTRNLELEAWDLHHYHPSNCPKRYHLQGVLEGAGASRGIPRRVYDDKYKNKIIETCISLCYLVPDPSSGEILLVLRHIAHGIEGALGCVVYPASANYDFYFPYKTIAFDALKLDFTSSDNNVNVELELLSSLGDHRSLFIGPYHCIALSTKVFPALKPDSVYFTDDVIWAQDRIMKTGTYGGHDSGIYKYQDRKLEPCYFSPDLARIRPILPAPIWYFTKISRM